MAKKPCEALSFLQMVGQLKEGYENLPDDFSKIFLSTFSRLHLIRENGIRSMKIGV